MTDEVRSVYKRIEECESKGNFDEHTSPPPMDLAVPVDENFKYLKFGVVDYVKTGIAHRIDKSAEKHIINKLFELETIGQENLEGVSNSIVVCNHVHMFDCVIVRSAYNRNNIFITAAEFNNRSDFLGYLMRYNGMLPFSSNIQAMRNINSAISKILHSEEGHVLIFPEASEWLYYKKPRPFKPGAFHYAVTNNVPVQPMFITFKNYHRLDKDGNPCPKATLHILPAIYSKPELSKKENQKYLCEASFNAMKDVYERVYGVKLSYTCDQDSQLEQLAVSTNE